VKLKIASGSGKIESSLNSSLSVAFFPVGFESPSAGSWGFASTGVAGLAVGVFATPK
jgi:hypothetical protein